MEKQGKAENKRLQEIETEIETLKERAMNAASRFWDTYHQKKEGRPGRLGVKVDIRGTGVTIRWYIVSGWAPQGFKNRVFSTCIPIGKGAHKYQDSTFAWCRDWEKETAIECEKDFADIRKQMSVLSRERRSIYMRRQHREGSLGKKARAQR